MAVAWKCSCGWETGEVDPEFWQGWWSKAMGHQYHVHGNKQDGDGQYIRGLFDLDTGLQITEGLAKADAKAYFGNDGRKGTVDNHKRTGSKFTNKGNSPHSTTRGKNKQDIDETTDKPTPITASQSVGTTPQRAKKNINAGVTPTNIKGVVQGWQIPIPAPAMAYFSLARKHIRDDDNNPYEFTPEGFAKYIQDVYFHWHEDNIAIVLFGNDGIKLMNDARARSTMDKVVQEISGMTPQRDEIKELINKMMSDDDSDIEVAATYAD